MILLDHKQIQFYTPLVGQIQPRPEVGGVEAQQSLLKLGTPQPSSLHLSAPSLPLFPSLSLSLSLPLSHISQGLTMCQAVFVVLRLQQ